MKSERRRKLENKLYKDCRWLHLRKVLIYPGCVCENCEMLLAWQLHHKISPFTPRGFEFDEKLAYDPNNLQALCAPCHGDMHNKHKSKCNYCGKKLDNGSCEWCASEDRLYNEQDLPDVVKRARKEMGLMEEKI